MWRALGFNISHAAAWLPLLRCAPRSTAIVIGSGAAKQEGGVSVDGCGDGEEGWHGLRFRPPHPPPVVPVAFLGSREIEGRPEVYEVTTVSPIILSSDTCNRRVAEPSEVCSQCPQGQWETYRPRATRPRDRQRRLFLCLGQGWRIWAKKIGTSDDRRSHMY